MFHLPQLGLVEDAIASIFTAAEHFAHFKHPRRRRWGCSRTALSFARHFRRRPLLPLARQSARQKENTPICFRT
jgi:hypothetical protein